MDLRWIVLLLSHYLLFFLLGEWNHFCAPLGLYFLPAGLFVAYAGMRLNPRPGLYATFGAGLLLDAGRPVPWGLQVFLLLGLYAIIATVRSRIGQGELWRLFLVATLATPAHLLILSLALAPGTPDPAAYASRCLADGLLSTAATALLAPWWFSLQERLLSLMGFDRRAEEAETA
jgi:rod shape-determining protein MreD